MNVPAFDYAMMLGIGAGLAFLLVLAIGLLFNLVERRQRARPMRLDRFGSPLDE